MNVIFLMFAFPDMDISFNMYTTLVEEFHKRGHNVKVVAPAHENKKTSLSKELDISILRVKVPPIKNTNNLIKGLSNILLPYLFSKQIDKYFKGLKFDLIISPTPPITLVDLAVKLKSKHTCPFYLLLRDIFPQNAVDLGFMKKKSFVYDYFRNKERKLYQSADHIGCMSKRNIDYLVSHNPKLNQEKLHILRNFQKPFRDNKKNYLKIKSKYHLEDKFVVVFGGNMGKPQQLENILDLAKLCCTLDDVIFLFVGEGVQINNLRKNSKHLGLNNINIIDTISKNEFQNLIKACDIGLISLHEKFTIPNIPSKILDYFNVGIPVLASIDRATDLGVILEETKTGLWSIAGDIESFKHNFDYLYNNFEIREEMKRNGKKYFGQKLVPEIAYNTIIDVLK